MAEWPIERPLGQCSGTGRTIEEGEDYFAALVETDEGLSRRDFCKEYWESEGPEVYCYWKTRLSDSDEKKPMFVDDDMLMAFFDRLESEEDGEKVNFRFVLALILMRKKQLKYDSSRTKDGREVWRLRVRGEDRYVEVTDPHLDEEQVEQLSEQLGQILQVEL